MPSNNNDNSVVINYDFLTNLKPGIKEAEDAINDIKLNPNLSDEMKKELDKMKKDIQKQSKLIQQAMDRILEVEVSTNKFDKFQKSMTSSINTIVQSIADMGQKLENVGVNNSLGQVASDIKNVGDSANVANDAISNMIKNVKGTDVSIKIDTKTFTDEINAVSNSLKNTLAEYEKWQNIDPWETVSHKGKELKTDDELLDDLKKLDSEYEDTYKSAIKLEKEIKNLKPKSQEWVVATAKLNDYKLQLFNVADKIAAIRDVLDDREVDFGKLGDLSQSNKAIDFLDNIYTTAPKAMEALEKLASTFRQTAEVVSKEQLDGADGALNLQVKIATNNETLYKQLVGKINYIQRRINESQAIVVPVKIQVQGTPYAESKKGNLTQDSIKKARKSVQENAEGVQADLDKTINNIFATTFVKARQDLGQWIRDIRDDIKQAFAEEPIPVTAEITKESLESLQKSLKSDELTGAVDLSEGVEKVGKEIDSISNKATKLVEKLKDSTPDYSDALKQINDTVEKLIKLQKNVNNFGGLKINDGKIKLDISELVQEFQKLIDAITEAKNDLSKPISLDSQWYKIGETFHELADETGKIDFRKNKKELLEFIEAYEKYVKLGGTNTLSALTDNSSTLKKLQAKTSISVDSNRQIEESDNKLKELSDTLERVKTELKNVQELISKIKIDAAQIQTFEKLGEALKNVAEALESINKLNNIDALTNIQGLDSIAGFIEKLDSLSNASKTLSGLKLSQKNLDSLEKIPEYLKKIREELEELDKLPASNFLAQLNQITEKADALSDLAKILKSSRKDVENTVKELVPSQQIKESVSAVNSINKSLEKLNREHNTEKFPSAYAEKLAELDSLIKEFNELASKSPELLTQEDVVKLDSLAKRIKDVNYELKEIPKLASKAHISNAISKINKFLAQSTKLTKAEKLQLEDLINNLRNPQLDVNQFKEIMTTFNGIENNAIQAGRATSNFFDAIKNKLKYGWAEAFARFFSLYDIIRYIREVSSTVTELNSNLIELAKVSDASIGELYKQFSDFRDISKETGSTINDVITATADWARMGYSLPDAEKLAEVAQIYKAVGDGISSDEANEYLISALQGFGKTADEALHIVDVYNEVANNFAIDTQGIGESLERSAASFRAANTSLEESVALVTSANTVLQNPESVGTIFKTLSARIRGATSELEELGEESVVTTSKLREMVKAMTGFDIMKSETEYKSIYEILVGIGKVWDNLTDIERASLGEMLAGKRNSNALYAVLQNIDTLESAYTTALDAEGSAMREHEAYMSGVQAQIDLFKASVENLANTFMSSDFLKGAINTGTKLVDILDTLINQLGSIPTLLTAISVAFSSKLKGLKGGLGVFSVNEDTNISDMATNGSYKELNTLVHQYNEGLKDLYPTIEDVTERQKIFKKEMMNTHTVAGEYFSTLSKDGKASMSGLTKQIVKATAKQIALNAVTAIGTGLIVALASALISKLVSAIDDWVHANERAIEAGKEAKQVIQETQDALENQQKIIDESAKRFAELSQGIDQISGKNISLSDEDYQEFLDISNQLVEVFPTLTHHYDENGNAIADLDGDVNTIVKSLHDLLDVEKQLAQQKILEETPEVFEGVKGNIEQLRKETKLTADETEDYLKYVEALESIGAENLSVHYKGTGRTAKFDYIELSDLSFLSQENIDKIAEEYGEDISGLIRQLNEINRDVMKEYDSLSPYISTYLYNSYDFSTLSPKLQSGVQELINNLDWNKLDFEDWDEATDYIDEKILDVFRTDDNFAKQFEISFSATAAYNNNEITASEYEERLKDIIPYLDGLDTETKKSILVTLNLDNNGEFVNTYANNLEKQLENAGIDKEISSYITDNLTKGELEALYNSDTDWETLLDVDGYKKAVDEMKAYQEEGNVDLFNRPKVSGSKMQAAGWDVDPNSVATVFSSMFDVTDEEGNKVIVHVTPILPDGTVLSPEELEQYVYTSLDGTNDVLSADDKGIVLKVDTDVDTDEYGQVTEAAWAAADAWDVKLHEVQEKVLLDGELTGEKAYDIVKKYADKVSSTPFKVNFEAENVEAATSGIKELQSVYQTLYNNMQEGKEGSDLAFLMSDIEGLKEKLVDANGDAVEFGETWDEFFDVMTDGSHTFEEMEDALNLLLTKYVNATIDIENFDQAQADAMSTQLQLAGVTKESADAYVQAMTEKANAIQLAERESFDLVNTTYEEIEAFADEMDMSELAIQGLAQYALEKQIVNGITITTSADCDNLIQLATVAGVTSEKLAQLIELKAKLGNLEQSLEAAKKGGGSYSEIENQANKVKQEIQDLLNEDLVAEARARAADFKFDDKKVSSKSSGGSGKEEDAWKEAYEKELAELDHYHEMGLISDISYYEERERLNDKYFKDREKYTEEYNKNLEEIYKGFVSAYKQYVDDMFSYWEKSLEAGQISFSEYCSNMESMLKNLYDAGKIDAETYYTKMSDYYGNVVSNYDKAINAAQRVIKKRIEALKDQQESIKKSYQAQIDSIQAEIDALKEANEEREKELELQKALYELNRAENQRSQMVYESDKGFVYRANEKDIKDAQEEVQKTQYEMYISTLEKKIESLETEMENLTSAIDDQIDKLQDYSDRLGETANKWKEAQEDMVAASIWGSDWQNDILGTDEQLLSEFTQDYIGMQQKQADYAVAAANTIVDAYNKQIEALNKWKEALASSQQTGGTSKLGATNLSNVVGSSSTNTSSNAGRNTSSSTTTAKQFTINKRIKNPRNMAYGSGTDNAKPGWHEIAEDGDEIVLDNYGNAYLAKGYQLHKFEGGEKVINDSETQELLKGKYIPIEDIMPSYSSMMDKIINSTFTTTPSVNNTSSANSKVSKPDISNSINITIGDINVSEVDNATELAKAITNKLPNALLQELNRK